jgi:hypothetical protein
MKGAETRVSLTLVPPSPVTEKVILDVRAAVQHLETQEGLEFSFYMDREKPPALLHEEHVVVAPGSPAGAHFRCQLRGLRGRHTLIAIAKTASKKWHTEQPLEIISSPRRSPLTIDGAWVGIVHWSEKEGIRWNEELKKFTESDWRELLQSMHRLGMNLVVIQEVFRNEEYQGRHEIALKGYQGKAFYPSKLFPGRMPTAAKDPVDSIFAEADELGMHVLAGTGLYAWFDFSPNSLSWHKQVASELWEQYGHHPSFYGWYVSEEAFGSLRPLVGDTELYRRGVVRFFREFRQHCRALAPDKVVMLAPNAHRVPEAVGAWRQVLPYIDILCPFGFHRMPEGDISGEQAAHLLQQLCSEAGAHLWLDLEAFTFQGGALTPRPIEGLISDLRRFPDFEKVLCYQYPGMFNAPEASRKPGGPATVKLFRDYQDYLGGLNRMPR